MTERDPPPTAAPRGAGRAKRGRAGSPRTAARIAAVQALYQIEMSSAAPDTVIVEFRDHRLGEQGDGPAADVGLFSTLTAAASVRRGEIDQLIRGALAEGWALERLDSVVRALLRAGVCELIEFADVPARVVIDQYLDVAHAFLAGKETGFVNGVLDRLARQLRPQELGAAGASDAAKAKR